MNETDLTLELRSAQHTIELLSQSLSRIRRLASLDERKKSEPWRQTGRTTRVLQLAVKRAADGNAIVVVAANMDEERRIARLVRDMGPSPKEPGFCRVVRCSTQWWRGCTFDWIYVDHFAWESEPFAVAHCLSKARSCLRRLEGVAAPENIQAHALVSEQDELSLGEQALTAAAVFARLEVDLEQAVAKATEQHKDPST